ncbi:glycosyltransferase family 4 protein [Conexibacter sp. SYSU D00693]|uniref:glycosyltransferase family 4 protein n=1 Tax=Conexibacter sp. SYSU D00693 TaxID=2812560 RepID=UPI00196ADCF2|nr:glycosyltransferase family 4 protein [Conexibacter sp. SYSU D00693]
MRVLRLSLHVDWRAVQPPPEGAARAQVGGQAAQVARLTEALDRLGVQQAIVTGPVAGAPLSGRLAGATVQAVGPGGVPGVHRRTAAWGAAALRAVAAAGRRADVVHVHADGIAEPLALAALVPAVARRPVVLTLHCSAQATYVPVSRKDEAVQVVTRWAERRALGAAARTLVLTERTRAKLAAQGDVEVHPDAVDARAITERAQAGRSGAVHERLGLPAEVPLVVYVGRLSPEKGCGDLPALSDAIAGTGAVVAAVGDGPMAGELRSAAQERPGRLLLTGALASEQVHQLLGAADVLVLPSRHEELGSVLLEAQAAGLACVTADAGGTREAVQEGTTGLVVPRGDPAALAHAVRAVLADDGLRARARVAGPRWVAERFDVAVAARRTLQVYEAVVR